MLRNRRVELAPDGAPTPFFPERLLGSATAPYPACCLAGLALVLAAVMTSPSAEAHGIAGNRAFPGTLAFDDPAAADEAVLPNFSHFNHPDGGGDVTDNRINYAFQ